MNFDNNLLREIGYHMHKNPEKYLVSPDGKLFVKCGTCPRWHSITQMTLLVEDSKK